MPPAKKNPIVVAQTKLGESIDALTEGIKELIAAVIDDYDAMCETANGIEAPAPAAALPTAPPPRQVTLSLIPRHFWAHKEDIFCVPALGYATFLGVQLLAGPFALGVALGALISGLCGRNARK